MKKQAKDEVPYGTRYLAVILGLVLSSLSPVWGAGLKSDWSYYQKSGHKSEKWNALVEAGFEAFDGNNFNAAQSFLERAKVLGCQDGLLLFKLALLKENSNNFVEAIKMLQQTEPILRKSYSKHSATLELSDHLGQLFYQTAKYDEALEQFLKAIESQGENFTRAYLVGQLYRMKKQTQEAISYFEKALQFELPAGLHPHMKVLAQAELMKLYFEDKQNEKTLNLANQILVVEPYHPLAQSYRDKITHQQYKQKEREVMKRVIEGQ
ncbi:MAG: hypothetical protein A3F82_07315 [Deltaproteobacteria bacterium RIFCSPLOWO2_12_FULL_44_12]|nr:MAG: hypothetical protein A2712_10150 [Deltaproteobacteria bacterium RIFCSPHIGHO2_01_FULL_43_49]OGQ15471.1 MAG: hypothetical protein A3D22_10680 [Deltaproteobacteria bacterium RIFCSPHIGHO2_02_FULL_44_53]OGQ29664.1 MAG: hypothetical protein A3D98_10880 [Deltaproteobacteria bacterium RIFCSPHIGHO2_12_FULL_44_21]OGQ32277.1 MAG: hypothetical protein A2979_00525 [Deltaproteobacteria bacterium RIFCSPLOWO2_01_FULL_45_74]OGQ43919.1 MAG: hypothetical protein A3I70_04425 [Deltaproteobacteria bacterium 